eukprot:5232852-Prymnesium_polylepis.1
MRFRPRRRRARGSAANLLDFSLRLSRYIALFPNTERKRGTGPPTVRRSFFGSAGRRRLDFR